MSQRKKIDQVTRPPISNPQTIVPNPSSLRSWLWPPFARANCAAEPRLDLRQEGLVAPMAFRSLLRFELQPLRRFLGSRFDEISKTGNAL